MLILLTEIKKPIIIKIRKARIPRKALLKQQQYLVTTQHMHLLFRRDLLQLHAVCSPCHSCSREAMHRANHHPGRALNTFPLLGSDCQGWLRAHMMEDTIPSGDHGEVLLDSAVT